MRDKKLLPILICAFLIFSSASLTSSTFVTPPPATETRDWCYLGAVINEPGGDYTLMNDIDATAADPVQDLMTAHVSAPSSCVEANATSGLFAPDVATTANFTMDTVGLPPCTDCLYAAMDVHYLNADSVFVPLSSNRSDLASLPGWYWCAAYDNYAPSGMPDFGQRQDNWRDDRGWTFCGPTAVANCLWWLDSKYADPAGVPGDGNDTFPLVRDYGGASAAVPGPNWDDHNYSNVNDLVTSWPPEALPPATTAFGPGPQPQPSHMPAWGELIERLAWYVDTDGIRTGISLRGTLRTRMVSGIEQWLEEEALDHILGVTSVSEPDFYFIAETVERGDCVMLTIGWWEEEEPGVWRRLGGHYVTVAGVHSDELLIAVADPSFDQNPPDDPQDHNDAAAVSHDIWPVDLDSPRSDDKWWLLDYAAARYAERYPDRNIYGLVDRAAIISSIPPSIIRQAASAISTDSASLNMTYALGDQSTVDVRFAYRKAADVDWTETPWVSVSTPWVFLSEEGTHEEMLTGLDSNTAYEFKAELRYDETVIDGDVLTFATEKMEPTVTTEEATDITTDSATLNMTFTVGDYSPVEVCFNWREDGTDVWTETTWTSQASDGTHIEVLSELDPAIVYEFKAQLTYDHPALVIEGTVSTFNTKEKGRCFIATAAYCTPMAEEVRILREFRDGCLLTNPVGQAFVDFYYKTSPPIAEFLDEHPALKPIVRVGLTPTVAMSIVVVNTAATEKVIAVNLLILVSVMLVVWATRRRGRGSECTSG